MRGVIIAILIIGLAVPVLAGSPLYDNRSYLIFAEPTAPAIEQSGNLTVMFSGGGAANSYQFFLKNNNNLTWTEGYILPTGQTDPIPLVPGMYSILLPDGNGGQPESQTFTIVPGDDKRVVMIGHCISQHREHEVPITPPEHCYELKIWHGPWCTDCREPVCHPGYWEIKEVCDE